MGQTISQQVSIDKLDNKLYPTDNANAPYQLEIYHTQEQPNKNIGVLNKNTQQFSYKVGDVVDVRQKILISQYILLQNIVMNKFLKNYAHFER
jgi:hypothetical protein